MCIATGGPVFTPSGLCKELASFTGIFRPEAVLNLAFATCLWPSEVLIPAAVAKLAPPALAKNLHASDGSGGPPGLPPFGVSGPGMWACLHPSPHLHQPVLTKNWQTSPVSAPEDKAPPAYGSDLTLLNLPGNGPNDISAGGLSLSLDSPADLLHVSSRDF
eukprot:CAMPEP_0181467214 /NCGR_PEP_ID=MMETSP1110-20121109/36861_1 /TAXON_ID=174948 /ORGANISM="Symbiodinium sp., Strain CCMP421" /LENGTH=160 /DNA_ID=CAMNT_0023592029 /DNA_START=552 /DNA_END=1032 /DNA_ORIENTATION=+